MTEILCVPVLVFDIFACLILIVYTLYTDYLTSRLFLRVVLLSSYSMIALGALGALHGIAEGSYTIELGEFLRTQSAWGTLFVPLLMVVREEKRRRGES